MRISDWSSDVCSSDLIDWRALPDERSLIELEAAAAACFSVHPDHLCALPGTEIGLRLLGDVLPGKAFHLTPSYRTHAEMFIDSTPITFDDLAIGRASCRERVCQYV